MIVEDYIEIKGHSKTLKHYKEKGYDISVGKTIKVKPTDLTDGSTFKITCKCNSCHNTNKKEYRQYLACTNGNTSDYYCNKCKGDKIKASNLKKYGVENVMHLNSSKESLKKTLIKKYGVEHYSKTDDYKEKFKKTSLEKFGFENPFQNEDIKFKIKNTNLERYGVESPQQNKDILLKSKNTNLERYGVERPLQSNKIFKELYTSNLEKYGVENTFQTEISRNKALKNTQKKYGVDYYFQSLHFLDKMNKNTIEQFKNKLKESDTDINIVSYKDKIFTCTHKEHTYKINYQTLYERIDNKQQLCTVCYPLNNNVSSYEIYISDFLKDNNIDFIKNDTTVLENKQHLDFYLPEHKLAIEFDGLYWHSEFYKDKSYHLDKSLKCKEKGIHLIHIFQDDYIMKKDCIYSILKNKLSLIEVKIFARKCEIKEVSSKDAKLFLNDNHIQGNSTSTHKLGLYYNDELVSLMTFGYRYTNSKREFELIRFCNKINTVVVGASSKLFKYAVKNLEFEEIVSYSDFSMFNGAMYEKLGFKRIHLSKPNYYWVVDGIRRHRFNYNKKKLVKEGYDASMTEVEIMHSRGYYRIYGCGQVRWIYTK